MKILGSNKGQVLFYSFFMVLAILLAIGAVIINRMQEFDVQIRAGLIAELTGECDGNMAQCRIADADRKLAVKAGKKFEAGLRIRSKALKRFIRVMPDRFKFSEKAKIKWQEYIDGLNKHGLIKQEENIVYASAKDSREIFSIYYEMKLFLVKARANNYNFSFM